MATNLIELAKSYLTPEVIQKASALVGESTPTTRRALETATPTIVAGLAGRAASASGAETLMGVLSDAGLTGAMGPISERLRGMSGEELAQLGKDLLGRVFGARLGPIVDATAASSGVKTSAMSSLLGLAAPVVLGVLGHQIHTRHLDAAGLASLLAEQKGLAAGAIPASVSAALGGATARVTEPREAVREVRETVRETVRDVPPVRTSSRFGRAWPLLLLPVLILGALLFRRPEARTSARVPDRSLGAGITPETPVVPPPRPPEALPQAEPRELPPPPAQKLVEAPRAAAAPVVAELTEFLEGSGGESSRRFVFDDLNFEFATTDLTSSSLATLDHVAQVLKAHPNAEVVVEGYTDDIGLPAANEQLSLQRAEAVKNALAARGADADRITTKGLGQDQPRASNDTAEGRAKNRRTELLVTR